MQDTITTNWGGIEIMCEPAGTGRTLAQLISETKFYENLKPGNKVRVTGVIRSFRSGTPPIGTRQGNSQLNMIKLTPFSDNSIELLPGGPKQLTAKKVRIDSLMIGNDSTSRIQNKLSGEKLEGTYVDIGIVKVRTRTQSGNRWFWSVVDFNGNQMDVSDYSAWFRNDNFSDSILSVNRFTPPLIGDTISLKGVIIESLLSGQYRYTIAPLLPSDLNDSISFQINISGNHVLCNNSIYAFSADSTLGLTSFNWSVPPEYTIISGQNTKNIVVRASQNSGLISVNAPGGYSGIFSVSSGNFITNFTVNSNVQCSKNNYFQFAQTSTGNGTLTNKWTFGEGINDTSSLSNFNKIYSLTGLFNVKLKQVNQYACSDSLTKQVKISKSPNAKMYAPVDGSCIYNTFAFTDSTSYFSPIVKRIWYRNSSLIDSNNLSNIQQLFDAAGLISIKLIVVDSNFCKDSVTKEVNVWSRPTAQLLLNDTTQCENSNEFIFEDASINLGLNFKRNWTFDNLDTSSESSFSKNYTNSGVKFVKLYVETENACKDSVVQYFQVLPKPNTGFNFINSGFCENKNSYTFFDTSSISTGNLIRNWSIVGPGLSENSNLISFTRTFSVNGNYLVKLKSTSENSCYDSVSKEITIYPKPIVSFSINQNEQCLNGNKLIFTNNSSIQNGSFDFIWDFGNQNVSSKTIDTIQYDSAKIYEVKLICNSNYGCTDSLIKSVNIKPSPYAGSITGPQTGLLNNTPYLYNLNQQIDHTYLWQLNNATIVSGQNTNAITVQWIMQGQGELTGIITNSVGCKDTSILKVNIGGNTPTINSFNPSSGTKGTLITINGNGFLGASRVTFGNIDAQSFVVISNAQIVAAADNGASGAIEITTPNGKALINGFTYLSTGVNPEFSNDFVCSIYPNPAKEEITINVSGSKTLPLEVSIVDMGGRLVESRTFYTKDIQSNVNLSSLESGIYFCNFKNENGFKTMKFVVAK